MAEEEIKSMIQCWMDELHSTGFDWAALPDNMRDKLGKMSRKEFRDYSAGQMDAYQSVINVLR
jgi:hypothetical protein